MKIKTNAQHVEVSGGGEIMTAQIAASPKAFEMLSSNVYSNPIKAIVRELSANAADSHVAAKNKKPFKITLPGKFDPTFAIRDYGTGMSHEKVKTIYTQYFVSDKTDSNDFTGCMGIGSKSPWAYTAQFFATSWHNGTKLIYSCFKDEAGIPKLQLTSESKTDEPNGFEVKFAVEEKDFHKFLAAAQESLVYFDPQPDINIKEFDISKPGYFLESKRHGYGLYKCNIDQNTNCSKVIMGNIAYPVGTNDFYYNALSSDLLAILNHGVDLYVPLGTCSVTASREHLQYDDDAREYIKNILEKIVQDVKNKVSKRLKKIKSIWEARLLCREYRASSDIISKLCLSLYGGSIEFDGKRYQNYLNLKNYLDQSKHGAVYVKSFQVVDATTLKFEQPTRYKDDYIEVRPDKTYFLHDEGSHVKTYRRIAYYCSQNNIERSEVITGPRDMAPVQVKDLVNTGLDEVVVPVSSLIDPPKSLIKKRNSVFRKYATVLKYRSGSFYDEQVDLNEGGIYVYCLRDKFCANKETANKSHAYDYHYSSAYSMNDIIQAMKHLGVDLDDVYGVRPSAEARIIKRKNWIFLGDVIEKALKKHTHLKKDLDFYAFIKNISNDPNKRSYRPSLSANYNMDKKTLDIFFALGLQDEYSFDNSSISDVVDEFKKINELIEDKKIEAIANIQKLTEHTIASKAKDQKAQKEMQEKKINRWAEAANSYALFDMFCCDFGNDISYALTAPNTERRKERITDKIAPLAEYILAMDMFNQSKSKKKSKKVA